MDFVIFGLESMNVINMAVQVINIIAYLINSVLPKPLNHINYV